MHIYIYTHIFSAFGRASFSTMKLVLVKDGELIFNIEAQIFRAGSDPDAKKNREASKKGPPRMWKMQTGRKAREGWHAKLDEHLGDAGMSAV